MNAVNLQVSCPMPENCSQIIDMLISQRQKQGLTQEELAQAANLTQSVIARLENKKTTPQLNTLLKITKALNCDLAIIPASNH